MAFTRPSAEELDEFFDQIVSDLKHAFPADSVGWEREHVNDNRDIYRVRVGRRVVELVRGAKAPLELQLNKLTGATTAVFEGVGQALADNLALLGFKLDAKLETPKAKIVVQEFNARAVERHANDINEQVRDQRLAGDPRPAIENDILERVARDEEKKLKAIEAEEERVLKKVTPPPKVRKSTKDKTILQREKELDIKRSMFYAGRAAFTAGGEALAVHQAVSAALRAALIGTTARERARLEVALIPAAVVLLFFPKGGKREQTDNERMREEFIRHQIYVMRYAGGLQKTVLELLNGAEKDLKDLLDRHVGKFAGKSYDKDTELRIKKLMKEVRELRAKVHDKAYEHWRDELRELSVREGLYLNNATQAISPVQLGLHMPSDATLRALVDVQPFAGKVLKKWASELKSNDLSRIDAAIRQGLIQGETSQQIARRVVGSTGAAGSDGVTEITRRDAVAITRTAVNSIANRARQEVLDANRDVFDRELYVATLDARTTPICRSLDGKVFKHGKGPIPPVHFQCRSLRVALFNGKAIGNRPIKPVTEQQLLRQWNEREGTTAKTRDALPRGSKGAFDEWARGRVRAMTGTAPAATSFQVFLQGQPAWFQDDLLGKKRGKLFRDGGLTLDKFVDRQGHEYTLRELALRERDAFLRAGLDPDY